MSIAQFFKNFVGMGSREPYVSPLVQHNREARSQMKPREDTRLGYFVPNPENKIIVPVHVHKLREVLLQSGRSKHFNDLSDSRIWNCRRAFAVNNRLMEMPEISVGDDGFISLYEGNHRLKILEEMGEKTILVYFSLLESDEGTVAQKIDNLMALIGDEEATFAIENGNHAYCHVDFDMDRGMAVHSLDVSYQGPYYAIDEPETEESDIVFPSRS